MFEQYAPQTTCFTCKKKMRKTAYGYVCTNLKCLLNAPPPQSPYFKKVR